MIRYVEYDWSAVTEAIENIKRAIDTEDTTEDTTERD